MDARWAKLARAASNLRAKWSEVSFEKKLAMFVAPVFVAVTSALLITLIEGGGGDGDDGGSAQETTATTRTTPAAGLRVAGLAVRDASDATHIDVTLSNGGGGPAFVGRAEFRIAEFRTVSTCLPQAYLPPSHTYDLVLPSQDAKGKVVDVDMSQAIKPAEVDRVSFRVGVDASLISTTSYLYRLELVLHHDGSGAPLRAGTLAVTKPFPSESWFDDDRDPEVAACTQRNRAALAAVLAGAAVMSPALRALGRTAQAAA